MLFNVSFLKLWALLGVATVGVALGWVWWDTTPIFFESLESKTQDQKPIFNKVQFHPGFDKDIWLMEQSHHGVAIHQKLWDKIAIVVDKANKPYTAKFYQLESGTEPISMNLKPVPLKASCYMCHPSGPRALRPNLDSHSVKLSFLERLKVQLWNLRIKTYGPMKLEADDPLGKFRMAESEANQDIQLKGCVACHSGKGWLARNVLTLQNRFTIKYMVENKFMPPVGFILSEEEEAEILGFIGGGLQNL